MNDLIPYEVEDDFDFDFTMIDGGDWIEWKGIVYLVCKVDTVVPAVSNSTHKDFELLSLHSLSIENYSEMDKLFDIYEKINILELKKGSKLSFRRKQLKEISD